MKACGSVTFVCETFRVESGVLHSEIFVQSDLYEYIYVHSQYGLFVPLVYL